MNKLLSLILCAFLTPALFAESKIAFRQIMRVHPVVVQAGTSAEVVVNSHFTLNHTHTVAFDPQGPQMKFAELEPKPVEWSDPQELDTGTPFRFQATIPAGQTPGVYEYRVATERAVSSVGHLLVTEYPVVVEEEENNSRDTAQGVSAPVAIAGVIQDFGDVDYYRFQGEEGEDVTVQIFAQRVTESIHSMAIRYPKIHLMDSILTLYGPSGRMVGHNANFIGGDAFVHCKLSVTGEYVLEVRDTRYAGDARYVYGVEITKRPHAYGIFPMAVQREGPTDVELVLSEPVNRLSIAQTEEAAVVSANRVAMVHVGATRSTLGWQRAALKLGSGASNPVWLLVSDHPQVAASGKNLSPESAEPLELPVGVSGRFPIRGQTHYYRFQATKDTVYLFEMNSQQRDYAVDSTVTIRDENGKKLASADDGQFHKDAKLFFRAPADGSYVVAVRDVNKRGGDRFVYHLMAEPSGPDFELHGDFYYGMIVPGGPNAVWFADIKRLNGFDGPVEIRADNLPAGVSFTPVTIPAGATRCGLIFAAAPEAEINASLVRLTGHANLARPGGPIDAVRDAQVTARIRRAGSSGFYRWPIRTQFLGVTKPMDVRKVEVSPAEIVLEPGGEQEITVRIERSPEFTEQVLIDIKPSHGRRRVPEQLPAGLSLAPESDTKLVGDDLEAKLILRASEDAMQLERFPFAVMARVVITYTIRTNYASSPIFLTIRRSDGDESISK